MHFILMLLVSKQASSFIDPLYQINAPFHPNDAKKYEELAFYKNGDFRYKNLKLKNEIVGLMKEKDFNDLKSQGYKHYYKNYVHEESGVNEYIHYVFMYHNVESGDSPQAFLSKKLNNIEEQLGKNEGPRPVFTNVGPTPHKWGVENFFLRIK